jgi:hypothetical protein
MRSRSICPREPCCAGRRIDGANAGNSRRPGLRDAYAASKAGATGSIRVGVHCILPRAFAGQSRVTLGPRSAIHWQRDDTRMAILDRRMGLRLQPSFPCAARSGAASPYARLGCHDRRRRILIRIAGRIRDDRCWTGSTGSRRRRRSG